MLVHTKVQERMSVGMAGLVGDKRIEMPVSYHSAAALNIVHGAAEEGWTRGFWQATGMWLGLIAFVILLAMTSLKSTHAQSEEFVCPPKASTGECRDIANHQAQISRQGVVAESGIRDHGLKADGATAEEGKAMLSPGRTVSRRARSGLSALDGSH